MGRPCVLCRKRARYGRACDECRAGVRRAGWRAAWHERAARDRRPAGMVPTEPFREALVRSGDPIEAVAERVGVKPATLRRRLGQRWVSEAFAERLCAALHVAPVEVGL